MILNMTAYVGHLNKLCNSNVPENKVYGANMGPTWGRQDPGGPHVVE